MEEAHQWQHLINHNIFQPYLPLVQRFSWNFVLIFNLVEFFLQSHWRDCLSKQFFFFFLNSSHLFRSPRIQDQGVGRPGSFRRVVGRSTPRPCELLAVTLRPGRFLPRGHSTSVSASVFVCLPLCVSLGQISLSLFFKENQPLDLSR